MGVYGVVDLVEQKSVAFIPREDPLAQDLQLSTEEFAHQFKSFDLVYQIEEMEDHFQKYLGREILLLVGTDTRGRRPTIFPDFEFLRNF